MFSQDGKQAAAPEPRGVTDHPCDLPGYTGYALNSLAIGEYSGDSIQNG